MNSPPSDLATEVQCRHQKDVPCRRPYRPVVVYNPTTSEQEIRPLNEVASSHLARRCFVCNLYKQVKDPNLVGALSGHKEGSRAFARYRVTDGVAEANAKEIDEDMKRDLVSMLE